MRQIVDIDAWKRKDQYLFFKDYESPFFNVTADVDIAETRRFIKSENLSSFLSLLYLTLRAANENEAFRYRIEDDQVVLYDTIHAGSTILNDDETFGFCYFDYHTSFEDFYGHAERSLKIYREGNQEMKAREDRHDLIHYSVTPWVHFRGVSHARRIPPADSVPKLVMGKFEEQGDVLAMPLALDVHHALMDGIHVGKYYEQLQMMLDRPEIHLGG